MSWKKTSLVISLVVALSAALGADGRIVPPAVPDYIQVDAGLRPFLRGHAVGTQNFICATAATPYGFDWLFIGPQATVFDADNEQILTHFHSQNPFPGAGIEATWQHSRDTSAVWATRVRGSLDSAYVSPGAIEWLLLRVTGKLVGPDGGDKLVRALFIHRVNTVGGMKPQTAECNATTLNTRRLVPYEADYYFYE